MLKPSLAILLIGAALAVTCGCATQSADGDSIVRIGGDFDATRRKLASHNLQAGDPWKSMAWAWTGEGDPHEAVMVDMPGDRALVIWADGPPSKSPKKVAQLEIIERIGQAKSLREYRSIEWVDLATWKHKAKPDTEREPPPALQP